MLIEDPWGFTLFALGSTIGSVATAAVLYFLPSAGLNMWYIRS